MDRDACMCAGRSPRDRESGVALIVTLLILMLLMALAAALTMSVVSDTKLRSAYERATAGFYAAESGIDRGMGGYRDLFLAYGVPTGSDFQAKTLTVGKRTVTYRLADRNPTPGIPTTVQIPFGQVFGGLNAQQYTYIVNSSAVNTLGDTEATIGAEFEVGYIPLFQFVAFYKNDLEIDPGAPMNLNGRVHTNGNLYFGPDTNGNLTISTNAAMGVNYVQVTAAGNIERGRKDDGTCNTTPTLQVSTGSGTLKTLSCSGTRTSIVPAATLATWGGTMLSGISSINMPPASITSRGGGDGTYWGQADLRLALILNYPNGWLGQPYHKIAVLDSSGNIDTTKQTALENFIFQNPAATNSTSGNLRPLFYSDVPTQGGQTGCTNCSNANPSGCTSALTGSGTGVAACYSPQFADQYSSTSCPAASVPRASRVYGQMNSTGRAGNANCLADRDPRHGGFYNWREHRWTYLLNLNVHDLLQWNIDQNGPFFSPSDTTDGGIVLYLTVYDYNYPTTNPSPNLSPDGTTSSFGFGVRIFGSSALPFPSLSSLGNDPTGITIASDRATYLQGDYNLGNGAPYNPTNLWQPSSLVGDAMNVMSNNWFQTGNVILGNSTVCTNDCQSNRSLVDAARNASATTVNAAFLSGVDTTTSGNYNGGLENYPRFHENWSSVAFNYLGSFVSLGTPSTVTGSWCGTGGSYNGGSWSTGQQGCNIYNPPARNWNFDPNFQNAAFIPPLTPRFVYVEQIRFTENFQ